MPSTTLSIGGLAFRLNLPSMPRADKEILPFVVKDRGIVDITVDYLPDDGITDAEVTVSEMADQVEIRYHPDLTYRFGALRGCLIYIPMEQVLLTHGRFFLHASFVTSTYGGLLFTGDSGAGKSTQAELWKEHMGSTIINGDRAIVAKEEIGWRAYGSPYAGSSGYYVKRDEPIRAVILLQKAEKNRVEPVPASEAFRRLFLQVSADYSRTEDIEMLCDLVTELISDVPVYMLSCTPDIRAVQALNDVLGKEEEDG